MKKISFLFVFLIMFTTVLSACKNKEIIISYSSDCTAEMETVSSEKTESVSSVKRKKSVSSLKTASKKTKKDVSSLPSEISVSSSVSSAEKTEPESTWEITSYSDDSGSQAMFYTIFNKNDKTLIVVDGGTKQNAEHVRNVIKSLGNHVTAWFLTHYHNDHIGAFNEIYPNLNGISIDKIYASPINYELYISTAQSWDAPEFYTEFSEITKNAQNVQYLNKDDSFNIDGLNFYAFSAYNDTFIEREISDIQNNGCLVFKVSGKQNSMLFMGDFHSYKPAIELMEEYRTDLRADYVQLAHHGNSSTPDIFYELVKPSYAFFDAPEYQMTGQEYQNAARVKSLDALNIKWSCYATAPNSVILK